MPDNICPDRFDPIDREANSINTFLMRGDSASATARLQDDLAKMGPTQFMALVGETKAMANASNALTHLEITPLVVPGDACPAPGKVDISLVTQLNGQNDNLVYVRNEVARIDNREDYQLPRLSGVSGPIRIEPPPPVIIESGPGSMDRPWHPPINEDPGIKFRINLDFGHHDGHSEPVRPQYRPSGDNRHADAPVIVNNNNTVIVKSDNSNSNSNTDSHQPKKDRHK